MNENFLFKLYNGGIVGLEEYYYSGGLVEEDGDWIDYAVEYHNEFIIELTKFNVVVTISNTYTEPNCTIGDIVLMLNANKDILNIMCEEMFIKLFEREFLDKEEFRDYEIEYEVGVI